jgi:hypothetical protein
VTRCAGTFARFTLYFSVIILCACGFPRPSANPQIEFTSVPQGGLDSDAKLQLLEGRVRGAKRNHRIVLFAKTDAWWVQPFLTKPFTTINQDGTWRNSTHAGTAFAALLVSPEFVPPLRTSTLPPVGGAVFAVSSVKGRDFQEKRPKTIQFSGYSWEVRQVLSERGGTINDFDPANAWTDQRGRLHLRITPGSKRWKCAEIRMLHSPGYGTYRFTVREVTPLEPAAVLSMYTWDASADDTNHREMDIEISRWGNRTNENAQFVIQPYYVAANVVRFSLPSGILVHSIRWNPGRAEFSTVKTSERAASDRTLARYSFSSGVPSPGAESWYIGLYAHGKPESALKNETEVVVERFEYFP